MNREKILAFLNIDLKKKIDKFIMKIITWFHVGFCVFVFGAGALLQLIPFSWFDIIALLFAMDTGIGACGYKKLIGGCYD